MASAKDIIVKIIPVNIAREFVKKHHYSGKVVMNSTLHMGCFLDGRLHGVMQFGSPMDKSHVIGLVVDQEGKPAPWHEMLELNRMAFDDYLPANSESRCIAIAIRLIRKNAPHIRWILSFADGCRCGDGTIYRASGFKLTAIKANKTFRTDGKGNCIADITVNVCWSQEAKKEFRENWKPLDGYMLRYIKIIDPAYHLSVPEIPFSKIDEMGAGMYKGEKISQESRHNQ